MMKQIVLCADDYGQAPHISQAIIELLQKKRLIATTCLVNGKSWGESAEWLKPYITNIDIGLHFNLTEGTALSSQWRKYYSIHFPSLTKLLSAAYLGRLNRKVLMAECEAQLDHFIEYLGELPVFIDGHQHVHQFPIISQAVISIFLKRLSRSHCYVRLVYPALIYQGIEATLKKILLFTSGRAFKKKLMQKRIAHNHYFSGIYAFSQANAYSQLFPQFIKEIPARGLIMCHPGYLPSGSPKVMDQARFAEYTYLSSNEFVERCQQENAVLSRFFNHHAK